MRSYTETYIYTLIHICIHTYTYIHAMRCIALHYFALHAVLKLLWLQFASITGMQFVNSLILLCHGPMSSRGTLLGRTNAGIVQGQPHEASMQAWEHVYRTWALRKSAPIPAPISDHRSHTLVLLLCLEPYDGCKGFVGALIRFGALRLRKLKRCM